jgi:hypothetical protein
MDASSILHNYMIRSVQFVVTVGNPKKNLPTTAIAGVDEGVRVMQVGGVRQLLIPPSLAYVQGVNDGLPGPNPYGYGPRQQIRCIKSMRKMFPENTYIWKCN